MNDRVREVEISIEQLEAVAENYAALERLTKNADFKRIIDIGYFEHEAQRLTMLLSDHTPSGDPRITMADQRQATLDQIVGVGVFRQYLATIQNFGRTATEQLVSYKEELELRIEEEAELELAGSED